MIIFVFEENIKQYDLKLAKLWSLTPPFEWIINMIATLTSLPVIVVLSNYLATEIISLFGYD